MHCTAARFPVNSRRCEFVSPTYYYNDGPYHDRNFPKQNRAPFLVSDVRIAKIGRSDLEISPNKYYPALNWKHRVTLGNSLQYTAARGTMPLRKSHLRRAAVVGKLTGAEQRSSKSFKKKQRQVFGEGSAFDCNPTADDKKRLQEPKEQWKKPQQRQQKPFFLNRTFKRHTPTNLPRLPLKQTEFIKIGPIGLAPECNPARPALRNKTTTVYDFLGRLKRYPIRKTAITRAEKDPGPGPGSYNIPSSFYPAPKLKSTTTSYAFLERLKSHPIRETTITRAEKDPGPGPGSYNIPSSFDPAPKLHAHKSYKPQQIRKRKLRIRHLDLLIENKNYPTPGKYKRVKSTVNTVVKRSNRQNNRSNAVSKKLLDEPAPNLYNTKYELLYYSNPKWSMKGSKRSTLFANVNTSVNVGPATYNIKNGDIGFKIVSRAEYDRRHNMVTKQPFVSPSCATPTTPRESNFIEVL